MLGAAISVFAVVALFGWLLDRRSQRTYIAERGLALTNRAEWTAGLLSAEVSALRRDVILASRVPPVQRMARGTAGLHLDGAGRNDRNDWLHEIEGTFSVLADASPGLSTVLFAALADSGREIVRIDVVDGVARVVPRKSLGTTEGTDYFEGARTRSAGTIYLSSIERVAAVAADSAPPRRVIRAATPVFAGDGSRIGMVMIEREIGSWIDATIRQAPPGVTAFLASESGEDLGPTGRWTDGLRSLAWLVDGNTSVQVPTSPSNLPAHWDRLTNGPELVHAARSLVQFDPESPSQQVVLAFTLTDRAVTERLAPVTFATVVGSISVAVTLLAAGWLIVAWALRPLRKLGVAAQRIGAGDYSAPLPDDDASDLGAFARAFRSMVDDIRHRDEQNGRAAAALRESEARFRQTLDDMQEGCQIIGFDWRYLYVNNSAARHGRRTPAELIGRTMMECYPGIEQTPVFATIAECMRHRTTGKLESEFTYPDGASSWFDLAIHPSREGVFITSYDISARKEAEIEQHLASNRILKQVEHLMLLDQITRAIGERHDLHSIYQAVVTSIEGDLPVDFACVLLYDEARHRLAVTAIGAKAARLDPSMHAGLDIEIGSNGLSRAVSGVLVYERDILDVHVAFARRLGNAGCRSLVLAPLRSESRVFGVMVAARREADAFSSTECEFLRQATEHVALGARQAQLTAALQAAYDDLRQSQQASMVHERMRATTQMASGIAHDINNALSPVSLYTEVLLTQETDLSARTREYLEQIRHSVQGVADTVSRMREFARPQDRGRTPTPIRLDDVVRKAVAFTQARWGDLAQRHGVTIQVVTELAGNLPDVAGVESEARDALTNLIFNAIDAMPRGGTITLRTLLLPVTDGQSGPHIAVEVSDDGIGMDEETRLRCLEPFFTTKGDRGTGLGLAMVFGMVQRHEGRIDIDSTPGTGTTFRISFPVRTSVPEAPDVRMVPIEVGLPMRILLVDDDPVLMKSLEATLAMDGHLTTAAAGGEVGIATFKRALLTATPYDAVITDLGMPKVDGRQVAVAVKELSPGTPVIMLTGWGRRLVADGQVPPHVDQVLSKPPTLHDLRSAIATLCAPKWKASA